MQIRQKISNLPYVALVALTVTAWDAEANAAKAAQAGGGEGNNVGSVAGVIGGQVGAVGTALLSVMFLVGVAFVGLGLMKLKQAADTNGQQVKYGEGMWRLIVGAGLVAVPAATGILTSSLGLGSVNPSTSDIPF